MESPTYHIALIQWSIGNGIGDAIHDELVHLGHTVTYFPFDGRVPQGIEVLFLYGPFGKFLPVLEQVATWRQRPTVLFWNTEGLPDPRLPWPLTHTTNQLRSWLGRWSHAPQAWRRALANRPPILTLDRTLTRFRYMGDFFYAQQKGWLDVFGDISAYYAQIFQAHGLPTVVAPFGSFADWYADSGLERDIDVLWMGKRGTRRRGQLLDQLRADLRREGVEMYVADDEENPFIFGEERTRMLNRAKITLNLLRTWYDENSLRMCMAGPNRSLFVSEPLLPHVPEYVAGEHYVSAPVAQLATTIVYYVRQTAEREKITTKAYQLLTEQVTMRRSMARLLTAVTQHRHAP